MNRVVLGSRSASAPENHGRAGVGCRPCLQRRRARRACARASGCERRQRSLGGGAKADNAGDILGAGARAALLPAATRSAARQSRPRARGTSAPAPLRAAELVRGKRDQIRARAH